MADQAKPAHKAGYIAIVGEPNVGKSTLLNTLLGQKISIVTPKPQTTRQRVLGILTQEGAQMIFLDTPGFLKPKYLLHREMVKNAEAALKDAEIILVLTEVAKKTELPAEVSERLSGLWGRKPIFLIINKSDTINKLELLPLIKHFSTEYKFTEIIPVSALKNDNVAEIVHAVIRHLPEHEPFYPDDIVSEYPERFFAAEFIREKLFEQFREEIPYSTAVEIAEFKDRDNGKTLIRAEIIVERESQKGIVIGRKGEALKEIGKTARLEIEQFLQHPVFLELHVKVREKWRENESMLRQLGYHSKE